MGYGARDWSVVDAGLGAVIALEISCGMLVGDDESGGSV